MAPTSYVLTKHITHQQFYSLSGSPYTSSCFNCIVRSMEYIDTCLKYCLCIVIWILHTYCFDSLGHLAHEMGLPFEGSFPIGTSNILLRPISLYFFMINCFLYFFWFCCCYYYFFVCFGKLTEYPHQNFRTTLRVATEFMNNISDKRTHCLVFLKIAVEQ